MSLRVVSPPIVVPQTPAYPWDPNALWYREARVQAECLDPETPRRVEGCSCRWCLSHLTDPSLVGSA